MRQLKKLAVRALGIVDMAASFFAFLENYDGQDWEEVDDQLLSENAWEPL